MYSRTKMPYFRTLHTIFFVFHLLSVPPLIHVSLHSHDSYDSTQKLRHLKKLEWKLCDWRKYCGADVYLHSFGTLCNLFFVLPNLCFSYFINRILQILHFFIFAYTVHIFRILRTLYTVLCTLHILLFFTLHTVFLCFFCYTDYIKYIP